jgi:hypothetical protein
MKTVRLCFALALFAVLFVLHSSAQAQGTAFTYQGKLTSAGQAANGCYDMEFSLYNAAVGGTEVGNTVTNSSIAVTNGLFTVTLDFGSAPFNGQALWLQIAVSPAGSNSFTTLLPLQALTSTPYAVQALSAGTVTGAVTLAQLPAAVLTNGATNVSVTGTFSGDGGALTNLNASQLSGTLNQAQLPTNVLTVMPGSAALTNVYSAAGVYTVTVPTNQTSMVAKLWGAGGGGDVIGPTTGGGGAFVQTILPVVPGQTFTVVVGQHGDSGDSNAGGTGSGDAQGGNAGSAYSGQGGQASSLFYNTNGAYVMKAVAGGGGGSSSIEAGGAGGNPGSNGASYFGGDQGLGGASGTGGSGGGTDGYGDPGSAGLNYAANATSTGIASLASANGNGGAGGGNNGYGGGGGGGYGGGGGAGGHGGGGGGGSFGQIIMGGIYYIPANTGDPNYVGSAGSGGNSGNGNDGLVVLIFPGQNALVNVPGTVVAGGFAGNGAGLTSLQGSSLVGTISSSVLPPDVALLDHSPVFTTLVNLTNGLRLNDSPIYLRGGTDTNHGLAYAGNGITNFGTNQPDGPALWGFTGGVLGIRSPGSPTAILSWNAGGVAVNGTLTAGSFSGNASGLTNLSTSHLTGTLTNPISTTGTVSAGLFSGNGGHFHGRCRPARGF